MPTAQKVDLGVRDDYANTYQVSIRNYCVSCLEQEEILLSCVATYYADCEQTSNNLSNLLNKEMLFGDSAMNLVRPFSL